MKDLTDAGKIIIIVIIIVIIIIIIIIIKITNVNYKKSKLGSIRVTKY